MSRSAGRSKSRNDWRSPSKYPPSPPETCRYCDSDVELINASEFYGGNYDGRLYVCQNGSCEARVGVHGGPDRTQELPLGTLANDELRRHRRAAHALFDPLWRQGNYSRRFLYKEMCNWIEIPPYKAHIQMLERRECKNLIWYLIKHGPTLDS